MYDSMKHCRKHKISAIMISALKILTMYLQKYRKEDRQDSMVKFLQ